MIQFILFNLLFFFSLHAMENSNETQVSWNNLPLDIQNEIVNKSEIFTSLRNLVCSETYQRKLTYNNFYPSAYDSTHFAPLRDGSICKKNADYSTHVHKKIHQGKITAFEMYSHILITAGDDGFIYVLKQSDLEKIAEFNFKEKIDLLPTSVHLVFRSQLHSNPLQCEQIFPILIVSNAGDYYYFSYNLEFLTKIDHQKIAKLNLKNNHFLLGHPEIINELITLINHGSFATIPLLCSIELAIKKNRSFFLNPKQETLLKDIPNILSLLKKAGIIGKESQMYKITQKGLSMLNSVKKLF